MTEFYWQDHGTYEAIVGPSIIFLHQICILFSVCTLFSTRAIPLNLTMLDLQFSLIFKISVHLTKNMAQVLYVIQIHVYLPVFSLDWWCIFSCDYPCKDSSLWQPDKSLIIVQKIWVKEWRVELPAHELSSDLTLGKLDWL